MANRINQDLLVRFLAYVLNEYRRGSKTRDEAIGELTHLITILETPGSTGDDPNTYISSALGEN